MSSFNGIKSISRFNKGYILNVKKTEIRVLPVYESELS
jgi:hypothetical protein